MNWLINTLRHFMGIDDGSGSWYLFHSGFGANFGLYTAAVFFYWHHTCHVSRCWRWAHHDYEMDGVTHKVCHTHMPGHPGRLLHIHLLAHHEKKLRDAA